MKRALAGSLRIAAVLLAWTLALSTAAAAQSTTGSRMAEQLRQNTVRVQSTRHGFGFIVGERNGFLYIATARHILVAEDQPDAPAPTQVKVSFYSDQGTTYEAEVLGTHQGDLAVLKVRKPTGFQWTKQCLAAPDKETRGTHVWFVGRRDEWYVPVDPGTIVSELPSTESKVEVERLTLSPGTSGAPLIADTGVVGMIQNDSPDDTRALTIEFIQRAFKEWNHPWDITAASATNTVPRTIEPPPAPSKGQTQQPASNPNQQSQSAPSGNTTGNTSGTCTIFVTSNPSGAGIVVGLTPQGKTPGSITISRTERPYVWLNLQGYTARGDFVDCQTSSLNLNLDREVVKKQTTNITLFYPGDVYGCRLMLSFNVGGLDGKTITPNTNPALMSDVPPGQQRYGIYGQITCGNQACTAYGSGMLFIRNGATYNISWLNTAYATCTVALTGPN